MSSLLKQALPKFPTDQLPDISVPETDGIRNKLGAIGGSGGRSSRRELEELLLRVELIEQDCIAEKKEDELAQVKDEFVRLKRQMYNDLAEVKHCIRVRHELQSLRGNNVEVIQKGAKISDFLTTLDADFLKLKEVFKKQTKQKATIGEEELDNRFNDLQLLKRQIEESKALYKNSGQFSDQEIRTLTDFKAQLREAGVELPQQPQRELFDSEKDAMGRWQERDQRLDRQLDDVGDVVVRLGEIAVNIGETADKQAALVQGLTLQANEASEDLVNINTKLKTVLSKGSGMNFFCKLLLAVIMIGEMGFLLSRLINVFTI